MGNNLITLYHNTTNKNAIQISKEGIKGGMRLSAYGEGSEAEGAGVWCSTIRGYGYGGATITFQIDKDERELRQQNDTEYIVYRDIRPEEIIDIDLVISTIPCSPKRRDSINSTVESDIPEAIKDWGKETLLRVLGEHPRNFAEPYNIEQLKHLIETGEKYCKGVIKVEENIKVQEGIQLTAVVRDKHSNDSGWQIIKDSDFSNKQSFRQSLRDNGYTVQGVYDNRDEYIREYTDYPSLDYVKRLLNKEKQWNKELGYETSIKQKELEELIQKAEQISLTESKIEESLESQANYLYTIEKEDPKYKNKITDIDISKTQRGEKKLIFKVKDKNVLVLEYPKKDKRFYYYVNGEKQGYESSVHNIVSKLLETNENYKDIEKVLYGNRLKENHNKLEEASRNELLAKSKGETITRYNKAAGYKGFHIVNIDTSSILVDNSIVITCRVGKYNDTLQLQDILYWIQMYAEERSSTKYQVNTKVVTAAIMDAVDGMDIKVDCECGDFIYRFAYAATQWRI